MRYTQKSVLSIATGDKVFCPDTNKYHSVLNVSRYILSGDRIDVFLRFSHAKPQSFFVSKDLPAMVNVQIKDQKASQ